MIRTRRLLATLLALTAAVSLGHAQPGTVEALQFSQPRGFYDNPLTIAIATKTPETTIRYTTDGSEPTETTGHVYSAPLAVSATTTLRARAFKAGLSPSRTETHTFVFVNDVLNQIRSAPPAGWPTNQPRGQRLVYGWNPQLKAQYSARQLATALRSLPSVSIVTEQGHLTDELQGIYVNATRKGDDWERPASVEWLPAANATGFHIDAGLRIRGGYSRSTNQPKHSFRLFFRGRYGAGQLRFPLNDRPGVAEFQTLDLRTEQNYSVANDGTGTEHTAVREVFARDLMAALGQPTTRSRAVHLYLNGQYWGLYQTEERAQEDYGASYFGGRDRDYDVMQTSNGPEFVYEVANGTVDAWRQLWNLARAVADQPTNENYFKVLGRNAAGEPDPGRPVLLDIENLATYMLLHYYTGDGDAPVSAAFGFNSANNWRGLRNRTARDGFRFFVHDAEHTLMAPLWREDRVNTDVPTRPNRADFRFSNPEWIHEDLMANPEYRVTFGDLAHRLLTGEGALTAPKAQAVFDARVKEINQAIVADFVRWGQHETAHTLRQWTARIDAIRDGFFPQRAAVLIRQLRTRGLYPLPNAPTVARQANASVTLGAGSQTGSIFYTVDGSDPRAVGGGVAPTALSYQGRGISMTSVGALRARFRDDGGRWSALEEQKFSTRTQ